MNLNVVVAYKPSKNSKWIISAATEPFWFRSNGGRSNRAYTVKRKAESDASSSDSDIKTKRLKTETGVVRRDTGSPRSPGTPGNSTALPPLPLGMSYPHIIPPFALAQILLMLRSPISFLFRCHVPVVFVVRSLLADSAA